MSTFKLTPMNHHRFAPSPTQTAVICSSVTLRSFTTDTSFFIQLWHHIFEVKLSLSLKLAFILEIVHMKTVDSEVCGWSSFHCSERRRFAVTSAELRRQQEFERPKNTKSLHIQWIQTFGLVTGNLGWVRCSFLNYRLYFTFHCVVLFEHAHYVQLGKDNI